MIIRRFIRHIKEGFFGVIRHFGMALSSASAVTITLLLVGLFTILTVNLNALTKDIEAQISLSALVSYDITSESSLNNIKTQIENIPGVGTIEYRSKDDEFDYYVDMYPDIKEFNELYRDDNPFHDAFLVGVENTEDIAEIKAAILKIKGIDSVYDGGNNTYILVEVLQKVRIAGSVMVLALFVLAVYLIYNTIKITIASREDEIWIMRNVGARNSYIRAPFLVEGIIIGTLGSIIPVAVLVTSYYYLYTTSGGSLLGIFVLLNPEPYIWYLALFLLLAGIVVGFFGSYISVCKFLRGKR